VKGGGKQWQIQEKEVDEAGSVIEKGTPEQEGWVDAQEVEIVVIPETQAVNLIWVTNKQVLVRRSLGVVGSVCYVNEIWL
jgi:hypothetical protein